MRFFMYEDFEKDILLSGRAQILLLAIAIVVYAIRCYSLPIMKKKVRLGIPFITKKDLCPKDRIVIDMLNLSANNCCFVVSDPSLQDNPLVYASNGFCDFTGYERNEILYRNCRFLQGTNTDDSEIARIGEAIKDKTEISACLTNYKKNGEIFINQFFLCPLFDCNKKLIYYLGVQAEVSKLHPGQQPDNPGWVFTLGNHE